MRKRIWRWLIGWLPASVSSGGSSGQLLRYADLCRARSELSQDGGVKVWVGISRRYVARAVLGHRNLRITDDYAELDQSLAGKAALKLG